MQPNLKELSRKLLNLDKELEGLDELLKEVRTKLYGIIWDLIERQEDRARLKQNKNSKQLF